MSVLSYFSRGWRYAERLPDLVCPDREHLPEGELPEDSPRWAFEEWQDGFLEQREMKAKQEACANKPSGKKKKTRSVLEDE